MDTQTPFFFRDEQAAWDFLLDHQFVRHGIVSCLGPGRQNAV